MKRYIFFALVFFLSSSMGLSYENPESGNYSIQDDPLFQEALTRYENSDFLEAARLFSQVQTAEGSLFAGKSYFAAGHYLIARNYLNNISANAPDAILEEARFTMALCDFQAKDFGSSLDLLYRLSTSASDNDLRTDSERLYNQILGYITVEQRKKAFYSSRINAVKSDIVTSAFDLVDRATALSLLRATEKSLMISKDSLAFNNLVQRADTLPEERSDSLRYPPAPDGIMYNVGLALPEFDPSENEYAVSQGLYYGIMIAAEEFNRRNDNRKISLHHQNPDGKDYGPEHSMVHFAWNHNADLVIGPLFSESAFRMAPLAEQYQIPLISPLANSDTLNLNNPYVFQTNPTFEKRGKSMAQFAVRQLRMNSLAVIVDSSTPGMREAQAFRNEAERLGAHVTHFFADDFAASGFDVSEYTPWFAGSEQFIDTTKYHLKPIDGLYLPFTGETAPTLINLILNNLEATRSRITILGNQELGSMTMSPQRHWRFDMFYNEVFLMDPEREAVKLFNEEYRNITGAEPNMFAHLGYDVGTYIFQTLEKVQNPAFMKQAIKTQPRHNGLILNIDFNRDHVNDLLHIFEIKEDGNEPFNLREYRERKREEERSRNR